MQCADRGQLYFVDACSRLHHDYHQQKQQQHNHTTATTTTTTTTAKDGAAGFPRTSATPHFVFSMPPSRAAAGTTTTTSADGSSSSKNDHGVWNDLVTCIVGWLSTQQQHQQGQHQQPPSARPYVVLDDVGMALNWKGASLASLYAMVRSLRMAVEEVGA